MQRSSSMERETVDSAAGHVLEQGRELREGMQQVAGNFKVAVDRSLRDQPMATLAMATVLGFALGAIWRS